MKWSLKRSIMCFETFGLFCLRGWRSTTICISFSLDCHCLQTRSQTRLNNRNAPHYYMELHRSPESLLPSCNVNRSKRPFCLSLEQVQFQLLASLRLLSRLSNYGRSRCSQIWVTSFSRMYIMLFSVSHKLNIKVLLIQKPTPASEKGGEQFSDSCSTTLNIVVWPFCPADSHQVFPLIHVWSKLALSSWKLL